MSTTSTTKTKRTSTTKKDVQSLVDKINNLKPASREAVFSQLSKSVDASEVEKIRLETQNLTREELEEVLKSCSGVTPTPVKIPKDPNAPKKGSSAYVFFQTPEAKRLKEQAKKEGKELAHKDAFSQAAHNWTLLSEEQRRPYQEMAEKDAERYQREMAKYTPSEEYLAEKKAAEDANAAAKASGKGTKRVRKEKDPNAPKRAQNAFLFFSVPKRRELVEKQKMSQKAALTEAGRLWGLMSDNEKKPFTAAAEADKERYQREMAEYKGEDAGEAPSQTKKSKSTTTKTTTTSSSSTSGKEKAAAPSKSSSSSSSSSKSTGKSSGKKPAASKTAKK